MTKKGMNTHFLKHYLNFWVTIRLLLYLSDFNDE